MKQSFWKSEWSTKKLRDTLIMNQILMNKLFKLNVFTDLHFIICLEQNDITAVSGNQNYQTTEGMIQNHNQ